MRLHYAFALLLLLLASAPAPAQDDIRTTFGPGRGTGGIGPGTELQRMTVDQQAFPQARCNDNTPAIFYYRPASRPEDANNWLIHLQGGGACSGGLSCSQRWFSVDTRFGMNNMTSDGFPARTDRNGVFERAGDAGRVNPFDGYNHVFVHYCSSDSWTGTAENVVLTGLDYGPVLEGSESLPCPKQYAISFLGRRIFDAVIETLRGNGGAPLEYARPGGGTQLMPDLDAADFVVLSGGSAGGFGVIHNLDHLRDTLPAGARLVGLSDSAFRPSMRRMDLSESSLCVNQGACTYDEQNRWDYTRGPFALWGARRASDSSCLSYHASDPQQCADDHHILTDHVTTPYFVRMDLLDTAAVNEYQSAGLFVAGTPDPDPTTPGHGPLTAREFAEAVRADILALAAARRTAHEGAGMRVTPGAFAPACGGHDELLKNEAVYEVAIRRGRRPLPMFSVFEAWFTGNNPSILAAADENDSICQRPPA